VIKAKGDIKIEKDNVTVERQKYDEQRAAAEKQIKLIEEQLEDIRHDIHRAQVKVDNLLVAPIIPEPSAWEDEMMARRLVPEEDVPETG
jgi:hypothetical protein